MAAKISAEVLHAQLGNLLAETPDLESGEISPEMNRWLGRAAARVEVTGDRVGHIVLTTCAQNLAGLIRKQNAQQILAVVHQAFAKAELLAPPAAQGTFIPVGQTFTAFAAVGKVLATAKYDVLLVDRYSDEKVLTDYAVLTPQNVTVRLLTGRQSHGAPLVPAVRAWEKQNGATRPLHVRLAPDKTLHDRLILVDGKTAWTLGQSFKDLVARAHTSLVQMDGEAGTQKIAALRGHVGHRNAPLSRRLPNRFGSRDALGAPPLRVSSDRSANLSAITTTS